MRKNKKKKKKKKKKKRGDEKQRENCLKSKPIFRMIIDPRGDNNSLGCNWPWGSVCQNDDSSSGLPVTSASV